MIELAAQGVRAVWEPGCGHLPVLQIVGADVLHAAPWRDEAEVQADAAIPLVDRRLGGTFVCAPFGGDDVDGGPPHGIPANGPWRVTRRTASSLVARRAMPRGHLSAQISLRDGHPVLYQQHVLDLDQPSTFAHHPMVRLSRGGRLAVGGAVSVHSFARAEEPGRDTFLRGQSEPAEARLATKAGRVDWPDYPEACCEDFLAVVGPAEGLGWTAVQRWGEGDTILFLKRAEQLPLTCLWMSNGGRDHSPWNGRHRGVLGVEDACCAGADGFAAALAGTGTLAEAGRPLVLPGGRHVIPHAIVRLEGCHAVRGVTLSDALEVETAADAVLRVPFDAGHFR